MDILNKLAFRSDGATTINSADNSITLQKWQHICVTRTAAGIANIYINNVLSGSADQASGTPAAGTTNVFIGNRSAGDRTFDGLIDEVRFYNKVIDSDIRTQNYEGSKYYQMQ